MLVFFALVLGGAVAFLTIGRSADPPGTAFPVVVVFAGYPGASPQDMEKFVIKPIEDQLDGIDNIDQVSATAQEGSAVVVAQFKMGTNLDLAAIDTQRRVDTARVYMPSDMDPPTVEKNGASQPLLDLAVSSNSLSPTALADVVNNEVKPLLSQIPNVQTVDVYGTADREFHVEPSLAALNGTKSTLSDVFLAVASNNSLLPGGLLQQPTREASVNIRADLQNTSDIANLPLTVPNFSSNSLQVGNVAAVTDGHVDMRTISHYNGKPRLYVSLGRNIDADEIKSTQTARAEIEKIKAQFPQLVFTEIEAPADFTAKSLTGVFQSLLEGVFLTSLIVLFFLHVWRNAVVVLLAIPSSIFATFIVMKLLNFHVDSMSMMGLSLIIGILVDDSIVVLENITRHRDMGEEPMNAAINGRSEIGGAAVAITMVDVVVFAPIVFLPGIVGAYLKEFAAVVVIATLFSLLVSFTLTPMLAAYWSVRQRSLAHPAWLERITTLPFYACEVIAAVGLFFAGHMLGVGGLAEICNVLAIFICAIFIVSVLVHSYENVVSWYRNKVLPGALDHGAFVVFLCLTLLINSILLVGAGMSGAMVIDGALLIIAFVGHIIGAVSRAMGLPFLRSIGRSFGFTVATFLLPVVCGLLVAVLPGVSFDFVPATQDGHINMTVTYPPGTPIAITSQHVSDLEDAILKINGIKNVQSTVGRKPSGHGSTTGGNYAQLGAQMLDGRFGDTNKTIESIRKLAYLIPGGELEVAGDSGGGSGTPIFYSLSGPEDQIGPASEKVAQFLRNTPGAVNVQTSAEVAAPRLNIEVDRAKASILGVSPNDAATAARIAVAGAVATKIRTPNGLVDVLVQLPQNARNDDAVLRKINVRASNGTLVPLSSVATFTWTTAPTKIERLNRRRVVNVFGANQPGYSLGAVTQPLEKKLKEPGFLPEGVGLTAQGDTQFMQETFFNMGIGIIASFALVYMLMVILYGSFLEPLIVMFSVPVAIVGALTFLAVMGALEPEQGQSVNILTMLGIIMLYGLVAKNGILLVDYSNTLVKRGMHVRDAVLQAAQTRFRPILMTTAAMIFGMLPLSLGFAEGGEWRQAIGTVIIGGLLSSLVLTLVLVPMIYNSWMGYFEHRRTARIQLNAASLPNIDVPAPV